MKVLLITIFLSSLITVQCQSEGDDEIVFPTGMDKYVQIYKDWKVTALSRGSINY